MASFSLCPRCRSEYKNPLDRRFHAQPTACGPRLGAADGHGRAVETADPLAWFIEGMRAGKIGAMKGLGGYHRKVPIVITGFEPVDLLEGILMTVRQLEAEAHTVENQYSRVVKPEGNTASKDLIEDIFQVCDRKWRGVGIIPKSGYKLRYEYRDHYAEGLFEVEDIEAKESSTCISGPILKGLKKPHDCPAFGTDCTPQSPLGATMVSSEGACAVYYAYGRHLLVKKPKPPDAKLEAVA
jgi:hydrogenase expression/formation protein HypD